MFNFRLQGDLFDRFFVLNLILNNENNRTKKDQYLL